MNVTMKGAVVCRRVVKLPVAKGLLQHRSTTRKEMPADRTADLTVAYSLDTLSKNILT